MALFISTLAFPSQGCHVDEQDFDHAFERQIRALSTVLLDQSAP